MSCSVSGESELQSLGGRIQTPADTTDQNRGTPQGNQQSDAANGVMAPESRRVPPCRPMASPEGRDIQVEHGRRETEEVKHPGQRQHASAKSRNCSTKERLSSSPRNEPLTRLPACSMKTGTPHSSAPRMYETVRC